MLTKMRENMAMVMWILVIAFIGTIIFSWGMGGFQGKVKPGIIGSINGKDISVEYFENLVQQAYAQRIEESEEEPSSDILKEIRQEVWDELIKQTIMEDEFKRLGIPVTDEEVAFAVRNNPPEFIINHEAFQTDGKFDMSKYQDFLANPAATRDLMILEENYRSNIKNQKMIDRVLGTVRVSENEIRSRFLDQNQKATVKYVQFDVNDVPMDTTAFSEDEIANYYYAHIQDYKIEEARNAQYVTFSIQPTHDDSLLIEDEARDIMERIQEGENFEEMAKIYSDDESNAENGGDLGFFGRNRMVKEFEEAAFTANVGDLVGPVKTQFGFHIIKITDRKTENGEEQVKASHILFKYQASQETIENARSNAFNFSEEAKDRDFQELATIYGVEVQETDYFTPSGYIPRIGRNQSLTDFIFNQPVGRTSEIYYIREAYYIFRITGIRKESTQPLTDAIESITTTLRNEKRLEMLYQKAQNFHNRIQAPEDFDRFAHQDSIEVKEVTNPFAWEDYIPGLGRLKEFNGASLALNEPGEVSEPVKTTRGYFVIQLLEKTELDSATYMSQHSELQQRILMEKRNAAYTGWLAQLQEHAKIQDNRYLYYRDY